MDNARKTLIDKIAQEYADYSSLFFEKRLPGNSFADVAYYQSAVVSRIMGKMGAFLGKEKGQELASQWLIMLAEMASGVSSGLGHPVTYLITMTPIVTKERPAGEISKTCSCELDDEGICKTCPDSQKSNIHRMISLMGDAMKGMLHVQADVSKGPACVGCNQLYMDAAAAEAVLDAKLEEWPKNDRIPGYMGQVLVTVEGYLVASGVLDFPLTLLAWESIMKKRAPKPAPAPGPDEDTPPVTGPDGRR